MIDSAKKDSVQQVILQGMEATKQSVKNVFKVQSSIWQEEAIKHLPPKIKKEDIKWGNTIDLMDDYIWDNKARLAIIQLRLFSKSTTDMNGIPIGISLHGYCIYDTAQRKTLSYYLQWEVEWYD